MRRLRCLWIKKIELTSMALFNRHKEVNPVAEALRKGRAQGAAFERYQINKIAKDLKSKESGAQARGWNDALDEIILETKPLEE